MSELLKDARVRVGALLAILGASGVALILNQDSCTVKIVPAVDAGPAATADAGSAPTLPSGEGEGEGESAGQ